MGKLKYICLGLSLLSPVCAQSAANFDTKIALPAEAVPKEAKSAKPTLIKTVSAGPVLASRQVGPAELEPYLISLSSVFHAQGREKDPFGHYQDPEAKPVIKATVARASNRSAPIKATPLSEIVQLIPITTIMPGDKSFLVETRKVKQGDELPLIWRDKTLRVQVTDVTSRLIAFRNIETGEIGSRTLDMLPPGMKAGIDGISAPGMTPDRPNAPIRLDLGDASP